MPNTGPPFFAVDSAEAQRAKDYLLHAPRRAAFRAQQQARLRGNPARLQQLRNNFEPLIRR